MIKKPVIFIIVFFLLLSFVPNVLGMFIWDATDTTTATVSFENPEYFVANGSTLTANLQLKDVALCTGWQVYIYFDKSIVTCSGITQGPFLKTVGRTFFGGRINNNYNATHGYVLAYCCLLGMNMSVNGTGIIASFKFNAIGVGSTLLHFVNVQLCDEKMPSKPIPNVAVDSTVNVM